MTRTFPTLDNILRKALSEIEEKPKPILFGQAIISGQAMVVEIISSNAKTTFVRKAENGVPHGDSFKRHNRKHKVRIHGKNVIRRDYMK